ncbi:MAG: S49 family peptidase [Pseudomonadota bacterium]
MPKLPDFLNPILPKRLKSNATIIPVVRLTGAIGMSGSAFRPGLSLATAAEPLERAFNAKSAPAVALFVNSPGGSPVQSMLIFKRIRALAEEKKKSVLVYIEDVAASGGYMLACAGDEVIADASSIVGSIGVISASFGFEKAIEKLGIDRRVYTAGTKKMTLDPFSPEKPDDIRRLRAIQRDMHQTFIDLVKDRRSEVITGADKDMFNGEFWTANQALPLGLVDKIGDAYTDIKERFGDDAIMRPIQQKRGFGLSRLPVGGGVEGTVPDMLGVSAEDWVSTLEARSLWSRYGLQP